MTAPAPPPLQFTTYKSDEITLEDDEYVLYSYRPPAGTQIVSIGYQNFGNEYELNASQCFVTDGGDYAYVQLLNSVGKAAVVRMHVMLYTADGRPPGKGEEKKEIKHIR
jgi:hypothetical protein